jgi:glutathione peroxidase
VTIEADLTLITSELKNVTSARGGPTMSVHEFEATTIDGKRQPLAEYAGKTLLIVNVASQCGFTPQYEGLESLYRKHNESGLVVLGFPCDQFGNQEPGSESEIAAFCKTSFDVSFPLFSKIDVNGPSAHPLYRYLREQQPGPPREGEPEPGSVRAYLEENYPELRGRDSVKWNFTKFLVDANGKVVRRFEAKETPDAIEGEITAVMARSL